MAETRVARRYAKALFNVAQRSDVLASVESDLVGVGNLIENNDQFRNFLFNPKVGRKEKMEIFDRLFSDRITAITMGACRVILDKRREEIFLNLRDEFSELRRMHEAILHAVITTVTPLEPDLKDKVIAKLEKASGKKVDAEFKIDATLIGGIKIAYGNYVLDGTVKGGLRRLRDALKYDLLKQV